MRAATTPSSAVRSLAPLRCAPALAKLRNAGAGAPGPRPQQQRAAAATAARLPRRLQRCAAAPAEAGDIIDIEGKVIDDRVPVTVRRESVAGAAGAPPEA